MDETTEALGSDGEHDRAAYAALVAPMPRNQHDSIPAPWWTDAICKQRLTEAFGPGGWDVLLRRHPKYVKARGIWISTVTLLLHWPSGNATEYTAVADSNTPASAAAEAFLRSCKLAGMGEAEFLPDDDTDEPEPRPAPGAGRTPAVAAALEATESAIAVQSADADTKAQASLYADVELLILEAMRLGKRVSPAPQRASAATLNVMIASLERTLGTSVRALRERVEVAG